MAAAAAAAAAVVACVWRRCVRACGVAEEGTPRAHFSFWPQSSLTVRSRACVRTGAHSPEPSPKSPDRQLTRAVPQPARHPTVTAARRRHLNIIVSSKISSKTRAVVSGYGAATKWWRMDPKSQRVQRGFMYQQAWYV